ncbi:5-formyltetrahydrofolate cyclo-ligase [Floccifex sp.]|uniref:5-formyltetrahydrofolate cyclo-ligase n=1 Tax=Floccifex sp. TaxID=2815810 RepID=UPI003F102FDE
MDRKQYIELRSNVENRDEKEQRIVQKLEPFFNGNVGLYVPIQGEVNCFDDFKRYKHLFLPVVEENNQMNFYPYKGKLYKGKFNTLQPRNQNAIDPLDLDVIIVPLVGFYKMHRMGYGKGYYDRYLKQTQAIKIGVAFDCQEMNSMDIKKTDVALDLIVTESRTIWR